MMRSAVWAVILTYQELRMTKGNITKILFQFAAPLIASSLLQQLYNIADSMIAGNFIGEHAVAAIGVSTSIVMFFTNIIIGFTTGISIYIAQLTGRQENEKIGEAVRTSFVYLLPASVLMALLSFGVIEQGLTLMQTDKSIFVLTKTYISIIFTGIPFVMIYNICSSILRGMGNSKTSMQAIVIATFTNILVDILFVAVFRWGIMGAALATVLSQLFSCIYVLAYLLLRVICRFPCRRSFTTDALKEQTRLGLPCVLQSGVMSFGSIILQGIMNTLGVQAVTAITSAYRLDSLAMLPAVSVASALSTFTAQNMGAKQYGRVREGYSIGVKMMLIISITIAGIVILFGKSFILLFGVSEEVAALGQSFLFMLSVFYPLFGILNLFIGFLQGTGNVITPAICNITGLAVRLILAAVLVAPLGFASVPYSEGLSWIAASCLCYSKCKKVRLKIADAENPGQA